VTTRQICDLVGSGVRARVNGLKHGQTLRGDMEPVVPEKFNRCVTHK
jgi:hypothetical protein